MPIAAWIGRDLRLARRLATVAALAAAAALAWVHAGDARWREAAGAVACRLARGLHAPGADGYQASPALQSAGQFTLFSYFAPYYRQTLAATPAQISALFFWFGLFGLIGNVLLTRHIDRFGARAAWPSRALITLSLLAWPLAGSLAATALVLVPWALGCFSANSAQQARLVLTAPALARR